LISRKADHYKFPTFCGRLEENHNCTFPNLVTGSTPTIHVEHKVIRMRTDHLNFHLVLVNANNAPESCTLCSVNDTILGCISTVSHRNKLQKTDFRYCGSDAHTQSWVRTFFQPGQLIILSTHILEVKTGHLNMPFVAQEPR
jgi:hypothetical protein